MHLLQQFPKLSAVKIARKLQERVEQMAVATQFDLHKFCTDVVFTPISEVDDDSPLCQEKITTDYKDKDGNITHTKTVLKMRILTFTSLLLAGTVGLAGQRCQTNCCPSDR